MEWMSHYKLFKQVRQFNVQHNPTTNLYCIFQYLPRFIIIMKLQRFCAVGTDFLNMLIFLMAFHEDTGLFWQYWYL
jgi:hypothetical protein